jgi:hypothetical protein
MDYFEANRAHLSQTRQSFSFARNGRNALANGRRIVRTLATRLADSFHSSFGQYGFARHVQDPKLERGAADIWDQAIHLNAFEQS